MSVTDSREPPGRTVTLTIALLGHPVAHSISPPMQQAALDALGVDARYEAWDVPPGEVAQAVERLRAAEVIGANVTVPHKVELLSRADEVDHLAAQVGAVNTIVPREGRLHGANTDVAGVLRTLADAGVGVAGGEVVLIGAGGAARAVVVAMRAEGATRLTIANRTLANAEALTGLGGDDLAVRIAPLDAASPLLRGAMERARLVIHSTTLGMRHGPDESATPIPAELFVAGQAALDLVYIPERTPFLRAAEAAGAQPIGGLGMLVHQGAESFRMWTGLEPPVEAMFAAARATLARRTAEETAS
ncbi:MAG: shikimate dehydrogenase [Chloroflexi bacterium]|nr:shikimate dehydrogenase [Chloroflexota bacterium]